MMIFIKYLYIGLVTREQLAGERMVLVQHFLTLDRASWTGQYNP